MFGHKFFIKVFLTLLPVIFGIIFPESPAISLRIPKVYLLVVVPNLSAVALETGGK